MDILGRLVVERKVDLLRVSSKTRVGVAYTVA